jgi:hypothetical protein
MAQKPAAESTTRLLGLPPGVFIAVLVVLPALLTYALLKIGMASGRGGVIVAGLVIGAFWLMFLVQTARTVTQGSDQR